jgi:hypothetical protein
LAFRRFDRAVRRGQQRTAAHPALHRGHPLEGLALHAPVAHVERGHAGLWRARQALPQHREAFGLAKWQRPHQRGIGQREDGAVDADAECQRERGDNREHRSRDQLSYRQPNVTAHFVEAFRQSHLGFRRVSAGGWCQHP